MNIYILCYMASYLFARVDSYYMSGLVLIISAIYLYWHDYKRSRNLIHLRGLFSLFWVGGQGVSCLKLSRLQSDWSLMTWVCFLAAFWCFWMVFELLGRSLGDPDKIHPRWHGFQGNSRPVLHCIVVLTALSLAAFIFEASVLGYIPLFLRGVPHAYSEFHITGVHYFTVVCVLVPSLSVLYFFMERGRNGSHAVLVLFFNVAALSIPILCVSRFQLILAVALALFTYIAVQKRIQVSYVLGLAAVMIPLYLLLTVARSHDVAYLNGIFEMKNNRMPIFITQPYIYIANNYDNFNYMVENLVKHSWGLRMLFPVFALSGLKFLIPELTAFPILVNKAELTTLTLFYDAYYDFGLAGVIVFSCILGAVAYYLVGQVRNNRNMIGYLFYVQMAVYLMLSFFTTWFSNPATWFYLAVTVVIYLYCSWNGN